MVLRLPFSHHHYLEVPISSLIHLPLALSSSHGFLAEVSGLLSEVRLQLGYLLLSLEARAQVLWHLVAWVCLFQLMQVFVEEDQLVLRVLQSLFQVEEPQPVRPVPLHVFCAPSASFYPLVPEQTLQQVRVYSTD